MVEPEMAAEKSSPISLVAFDLDGTLLREETVLEVLARQLGHADRVRLFESFRSKGAIASARQELAGYYLEAGMEHLQECLEDVSFAPKVEQGCALLRECGITTCVITLTWEFAAQWVSQRLRFDAYAGTTLDEGGKIGHFWPEDKERWLRRFARQQGVPMSQVAAVGDSWGDVPMLRAVGRGVYIGEKVPDNLPGVLHMPDADIETVVRTLLDLRWAP